MFIWEESHFDSDSDYDVKWEWSNLYRIQSLLSSMDSNFHSNSDFDSDNEPNILEDLAIPIFIHISISVRNQTSPYIFNENIWWVFGLQSKSEWE